MQLRGALFFFVWSIIRACSAPMMGALDLLKLTPTLSVQCWIDPDKWSSYGGQGQTGWRNCSSKPGIFFRPIWSGYVQCVWECYAVATGNRSRAKSNPDVETTARGRNGIREHDDEQCRLCYLAIVDRNPGVCRYWMKGRKSFKMRRIIPSQWNSRSECV